MDYSDVFINNFLSGIPYNLCTKKAQQQYLLGLSVPKKLSINLHFYIILTGYIWFQRCRLDKRLSVESHLPPWSLLQPRSLPRTR